MYYHTLSIGFVEIPKINASLNIYTVGCPFKCKGCHNPDLQDLYHKDRKKLNISDIETPIKNSNNFINGICWLGGEPLFQFNEFIKINRDIRKSFPNIYISLFTGYTLTDIKSKYPDEYEDLIKINFKYIIDGQWNGFPINDEKTNQKIYTFNYMLEDYTQISYEDYKNGK